MAYADKRAANPGALGLTIGLNAAAVLGLALWNPSIFKLPPKGPWITIDVPPVVPPGPVPEDPNPKTKQQIDQPDPTIVTTTTTETVVTRDPDPGPKIIITDPGPGTIIEPPPPPPQIKEIVKRPPALATREGDLQPPYPPALQRQEIEGSVTVRILVGNDGRPKDIVLVRADHPDFFAAAKSWGMRHWRFKPASEDGNAVEAWYTLTVKFNIE